MKSFILLSLLVAVRSEYTQFSWKSCSTDLTNRALKVESVDISPMPVVTPGDMTISFSAEVLKQIDLAILEFNLTRHTQLGDVHIPCIGTLGSCILDGCSIVDDLTKGSREAQRDLGRQIKQMFSTVGIFSRCPISVQNVTIDNYLYHLPELSGAVSFIADGDYTVVVRARDPTSGVELGCFEFQATLKRKQQHGSGWVIGRRKRSYYKKRSQ